jgi:hypothetical protein
VRRFVERLTDSGRRIRITRRNHVRNGGLTGHYDCGFQLERYLKVERQFIVQVVLLMNTEHSTKGVDPAEKRCRGEDILKSCDGGITRSSSVFLKPKVLRTER